MITTTFKTATYVVLQQAFLALTPDKARQDASLGLVGVFAASGWALTSTFCEFLLLVEPLVRYIDVRFKWPSQHLHRGHIAARIQGRWVSQRRWSEPRRAE
jgi:hypothetical protein